VYLSIEEEVSGDNSRADNHHDKNGKHHEEEAKHVVVLVSIGRGIG